MSTIKVVFNNQSGQQLSAKLDIPDHTTPHNYALFAHCFTCNKSIGAIRNISRSLNNSGIAVLRFDFTGLGQSEGEFEETNFSSNVDDLVKAANFLNENYEAPSIIIGHSLGGSAAIHASLNIPSIKAIATIGSPSTPEHVSHLFKDGLEEIQKNGHAKMFIAGRPFIIKQQLIEDLKTTELISILSNLRIPIAVFHSPQDEVVGIENAQEIYVAAHHPKSFVSLDGADHMLSNQSDSKYAGDVIAHWATRYIDLPKQEVLSTKHQVLASLGNKGFTTQVLAGKHLITADEPIEYGGDNYGPSPYDFVASGLGACTAMTIKMYADRKGWNVQKVMVHVDYGKEHCEDCINVESGKKLDRFTREIEILGELDQEQTKRLMEIADKCPVHKTLSSVSEIKTILI